MTSIIIAPSKLKNMNRIKQSITTIVTSTTKKGGKTDNYSTNLWTKFNSVRKSKKWRRNKVTFSTRRERIYRWRIHLRSSSNYLITVEINRKMSILSKLHTASSTTFLDRKRLPSIKNNTPYSWTNKHSSKEWINSSNATWVRNNTNTIPISLT